jgi:hypothetical protein
VCARLAKYTVDGAMGMSEVFNFVSLPPRQRA